MGGVGLLTKEALPYLAEVFKDFEHRWNPNYRPAHPDVPFPNKPSAKDPFYREELGRVCDLLPRREVGANLKVAPAVKAHRQHQSDRCLGYGW